MKLIHLSDLHIGKRVNEISMIDDQEYILLQILQIIEDEKADAVLIAGDVYDKSVPSAEAVELLDGFLFALAQRKLQVFLSSGNHDSAERLAFGGRLMTERGIHISPVYDGQIIPVSVGNADIFMLPFLKPAHVKRFYPDEGIESYTDACRVAVEKMQINTQRRNVLLAHQFVTGSETCESEEISVGGSDNVDAAAFDGFDYVALGHLHGPQNIGSNRIRYCGTPLKYSFSEETHCKSVTVVELGSKGELHLQLRGLTPLHDLRQLRGSFAELSDGAATEDYLHIILTDEEDVPEAVGKLRLRYPNLMKLSYDNTRTRTNHIIDGAQDVESKSPLTLFEELYEQQNNQPMSPEQRSTVLKMIESIWEDTL